MEKYGYAAMALVRYNFEKEVDKLESFDLAICLLLNLTACLSKTNDFVQVGQLCSVILDYRPNNVKAMFRRAKAAVSLGRNEWAYWDLLTAIEIEPNNHDIRKSLEEIKGVLAKDKAKDDSKYEAPIGLGQGLPSVNKKCGKTHLPDSSRNFVREQQQLFQDTSQEVLLDKKCKSFEEKCTQDNIIKEEENYTKPMEDAIDQSPTNKDLSSGVNLLPEFCNVDGLSDKDGGSVVSFSTENSCVTEDSTNPLKNESLTHAEPKCRFYNRKRQGSLLTVTKSDYLSMTKGKTLIYGNAKRGAYMQIRVINRQPYDKSPTDTASFVEERVEQIYNQADGREEVKDNSDLMEASSDGSSCMTRENLPVFADTNYPLSDDCSGSSNTTRTPYLYFSASKAPKPMMMKRRHARMKRDDAKYANPLKSRTKNKRTKRMCEDNSYSYSCTNNGCVCRFEVGRKRKHVHPPLMYLCHRPRKKSTSYVWCCSCLDVNCVWVSNSSNIVYGSVQNSVSYEKAHSQSSRY